MRPRLASAESVVFPVPERPKKRATSPSSPTLAEQCMGSTPSAGRRWFSTLKIDFLISPAYRVPQMRTSFAEKFTTTAVDDRVPWRSGSARKWGAWRMEKSGSGRRPGR